MFKKSLLALALITAASSGIANAGTIAVTGGSTNVSLEGNLNVNGGNSVLAAADGGAVVLTTATAYIINDLVTVTVSGAAFNVATTPTLTPANAGTVFSFVDFSGTNTARFRVTTQDEVSGELITFGGYALKTTGAIDKAKVEFSTTAISTNSLIGAYDAAKAVETFAFRSQLVNTITPLNGEVSTGKGRAEFTTSPNQDVLKVASVDNVTDVDGITFTKVTHTIKGNFSFVSDYDLAVNGGNADGDMDAAEIANAFTTTLGAAVGGADGVVYTLNALLSELTVTDTLAGGLDADISVEVNNLGLAAGGSVITAPQSFTISSVATDGTSSISLSEKSAGKFTLDGSSTDIAFMPFGSDYAQSITVTNNGTVVGAITVTLVSGGMTYTTALVAESAAKTVTNISKEVSDFAIASGVTGNASVNVTTNSPGVEVKGIYYHKPTQDRVLVGENTTN